MNAGRYLQVLAATPIANLLVNTGAGGAVAPTTVTLARCAERAEVPTTATRAVLAAAPIAHLGFTEAGRTVEPTTTTRAVLTATPIARLGSTEVGRTVVPTTVTLAVLAATPIAHLGITEAGRAVEPTTAMRAARILYRN